MTTAAMSETARLCCRAMDDWLKRVAGAIGSNDELTDADADALLQIARIAAHASGDRRNAPLLTYLIGRSRGDRPMTEILEAVRGSSS
jgi:hypothetical protein